LANLHTQKIVTAAYICESKFTLDLWGVWLALKPSQATLEVYESLVIEVVGLNSAGDVDSVENRTQGPPAGTVRGRGAEVLL
jgi:hypothetical protein